MRLAHPRRYDILRHIPNVQVPLLITIGMVEVAPLTATAEGPLATITATFKRFDRFGIHVDAKQM